MKNYFLNSKARGLSKRGLRLAAILALFALMVVVSLVYAAPIRPMPTVQAAMPESEVMAAVQQSGQLPGSNALATSSLITAQSVVTGVDVMIVMDVSGSMELETTCYDCWRAYDNPAPDQMTYPNNGYFNPLPFDPNRPDVPKDPVTGEPIAQSIPESFLCTQPPTAYIPATNNPNNYQYLVHEAELYSANTSDWSVPARAPGRGVWVLQRATRLDTGSAQEQAQENQAGNAAKQSSNVCNPGIQGLGIDCTLGGVDPDTICNGPAAASVDCSAYVKAQPFITYQGDEDPFLYGASFDTNCFSGSTYNSTCWNDPAAPSGPGNIPALEYDFTPTWSGQTYIWIRAQGGGLQAHAWRGWLPTESMTQLNNNYGYYDAIFWQVGNSNIQRNMDTGLIIGGKAANLGLSSRGGTGEWRDNRARYDRWRWVKLGFANTTPGQQYTLRLYQGSSGYKIDKLIFTNNPDGTSGNPPDHIDINDGKGPRATNGSATREACNVCNPAYGYTVDDVDCTCKQRPWDSSSPSATNCTALPVGITGFSSLNDDLYGGVQPLRSAQEAAKRLAKKLDPRFDQLGFVAFTHDVVTGARSKLQCLNWAAKELGDASRCYDTDNFTNVLSYTHVVESIEARRPLNGTNIADGLREGLQELGVDAYGSGFRDSSCQGDPDTDNGRACDRRGAACKAIILLTDGVPSHSSNCTGAPDYADFWDHPKTGSDRDYECSMYYSWVAANNNVAIYTMGLGMGVDSDLLTAMATGVDPRGSDPDVVMFANARGGQYYAAATTDDLDSILDNILPELSSCQLGTTQEAIWSASGYMVLPGDNLTAHLEGHMPDTAYDIYLKSSAGVYKICAQSTTDPAGSGDFVCTIPFSVPPGHYELYSTYADQLNRLATAPSLVTVQESAPSGLLYYLPILLKELP